MRIFTQCHMHKEGKIACMRKLKIVSYWELISQYWGFLTDTRDQLPPSKILNPNHVQCILAYIIITINKWLASASCMHSPYWIRCLWAQVELTPYTLSRWTLSRRREGPASAPKCCGSWKQEARGACNPVPCCDGRISCHFFYKDWSATKSTSTWDSCKAHLKVGKADLSQSNPKAGKWPRRLELFLWDSSLP